MKKFIISLVLLLTSSNSFAEPSIFVHKYDDAILLSQKINKPVLLIVVADWCEYCNIMKQDIALNLNILDDTIVCYMDYDNNKKVIKEYKIKSVPTTIFLTDNKEISRKTGYKNIKEFSWWLDNVK